MRLCYIKILNSKKNVHVLAFVKSCTKLIFTDFKILMTTLIQSKPNQESYKHTFSLT